MIDNRLNFSLHIDDVMCNKVSKTVGIFHVRKTLPGQVLVDMY